jgi:hypothetical protein
LTVTSLKKDRRSAFQIAILDEGFSSFTWEELDRADTPEELDQKEKAWIAHYDSTNPERGYNNTDGGHNGSPSEKTRRRISEAKKGHPVSEETRRKLGEVQKGKTLSPEHRRKIGEAKKGHSVSVETRRRISETEKGKVISGETRRRMSEAKKGKPNGREGKHLSPEARRKMSEAHKGKHRISIRGERNYHATITEETARNIKIDIAGGMRNCDIYRKYNLSESVVRHIKSGKSWAWLAV